MTGGMDAKIFGTGLSGLLQGYVAGLIASYC